MNGRPLFRIFVIAMVLSPVWASAQIFRFDALPDLVPADISVAGDCRLVVTVANNGLGVVPSSGYVGPSTGIQMYMDGSPWGGVALGAMDTAHFSFLHMPAPAFKSNSAANIAADEKRIHAGFDLSCARLTEALRQKGHKL